MAHPVLTFVAAMLGTITGHLCFYFYLWVRQREESTE